MEPSDVPDVDPVASLEPKDEVEELLEEASTFMGGVGAGYTVQNGLRRSTRSRKAPTRYFDPDGVDLMLADVDPEYVRRLEAGESDSEDDSDDDASGGEEEDEDEEEEDDEDREFLDEEEMSDGEASYRYSSSSSNDSDSDSGSDSDDEFE